MVDTDVRKVPGVKGDSWNGPRCFVLNHTMMIPKRNPELLIHILLIFRPLNICKIYDVALVLIQAKKKKHGRAKCLCCL